VCGTHFSEILRAPGARGYRLVPLYKADGGPLVRPLFAFRNGPIATPSGASEEHSRGAPDFMGIAPPNILRTRGSVPDQFHTASPGNRVAHTGYMDKEIDCSTRQIFGTFCWQTLEGPACMSGSNPFRSRSRASGGCQEREPAFPLSKLVLGLEARCQV